MVYTYPEAVRELDVSLSLLAEIDPKMLVDRVSLEILAEAIQAQVLSRDVILEAWKQKIGTMARDLSSSKDVGLAKIQQFEKDLLAKIEAILK